MAFWIRNVGCSRHSPFKARRARHVPKTGRADAHENAQPAKRRFGAARLVSAFDPKQTQACPTAGNLCSPFAMPRQTNRSSTARCIRHDGWTNARRVTFFVTLAATGSVTFAVASVGLSRKSAYALKRRDAAFASLWERALTMAGKTRSAACPPRSEGDGNRAAITPAAPSTGVNRVAAERDRFLASLQKRPSSASLRPRLGKTLANG
jgi:hypothetical protein